jgi:hypothetical protein
VGGMPGRGIGRSRGMKFYCQLWRVGIEILVGSHCSIVSLWPKFFSMH